MKTWLENNLANYRAEHKDWRNEICHFFGISIIVFSLFVLSFIFVPVFYCKLILMAVFFWLALGGWRGLIAMFFFIPLFAIGFNYVNSWQWALAIFIVGWIFQFIGHFVFEKNKPAFLKNPILLFIAIFWIGEIVAFYPLWSKK